MEDFGKINGNKFNVDYHSLGTPLVLCKGFNESSNKVGDNLLWEMNERFQELAVSEEYFVEENKKHLKRIVLFLFNK